MIQPTLTPPGASKIPSPFLQPLGPVSTTVNVALDQSGEDDLRDRVHRFVHPRHLLWRLWKALIFTNTCQRRFAHQQVCSSRVHLPGDFTNNLRGINALRSSSCLEHLWPCPSTFIAASLMACSRIRNRTPSHDVDADVLVSFSFALLRCAARRSHPIFPARHHRPPRSTNSPQNVLSYLISDDDDDIPPLGRTTEYSSPVEASFASAPCNLSRGALPWWMAGSLPPPLANDAIV